MDPIDRAVADDEATIVAAEQSVDARSDDKFSQSNSVAGEHAAIIDLQRFTRRVLDSARVIVTALALAFVFRAFFVEPFIIPTGSMAPALLGDHWSVVCSKCGYGFDTVQRVSTDESEQLSIRCGNCRQFFVPPPSGITRKPGDRILVHKWIDSLVSPRRWEVCVFRDPSSPLQHYIKRIVGLPNERIEIIDGDVYIDDVIARKPEWAQQALWQPVFVQNHPEIAREIKFSRWIETSTDTDKRYWSGLDETNIHFDGKSGQSSTIQFIADAGEYCFDYSAYNGTSDGNRLTDIKFSTAIRWSAAQARCAFLLGLSTCDVRCELSANGDVYLEVLPFAANEDRVVTSLKGAYAYDRRVPVAFALQHLDQRITLTCNGRRIFETGEEFGDVHAKDRRGKPSRQFRLEITGGAGPFSLDQLQLVRDVYYTESRMAVRAVRGHPFALESNEYFALGDNSADSKDSREWLEYGPHLRSGYRLGTIPREKIVGKAAFVYLPGLQKGFVSKFRMIDIGRDRFIR